MQLQSSSVAPRRSSIPTLAEVRTLISRDVQIFEVRHILSCLWNFTLQITEIFCILLFPPIFCLYCYDKSNFGKHLPSLPLFAGIGQVVKSLLGWTLGNISPSLVSGLSANFHPNLLPSYKTVICLRFFLVTFKTWSTKVRIYCTVLSLNKGNKFIHMLRVGQLTYQLVPLYNMEAPCPIVHNSSSTLTSPTTYFSVDKFLVAQMIVKTIKKTPCTLCVQATLVSCWHWHQV